MRHTPSYFAAVQFALEKHAGQLYGKRPYAVHLVQVEQVLVHHGYGLKHIVAGWLHDVVEDTPATVEEVVRVAGREVADIVTALTDEPGATRKERKAKTLPKIAALPDAVPVKLADRIANWTECLAQGDSKIRMYLEEHAAFREALYRPGQCESMWLELERLRQKSLA